MKVALLANLKQNAPTWPDMPPDQWDEFDAWETVQSISIALEKRGHRVTFLEGDKSLYNNLDAVQPEICFNLCRGHFGPSRESQIPAILELLRIPYTGSPVLTLAMAMDKPMTRRMLLYHGLPTPAFQLFAGENEPLEARLHFPLRVKPSRAETALELRAQSVVYDQKQLQAQLRCIIDRYHQPALVEQFLEGRRITVALVGNVVTPTARHIPDDGTDDRIFQGLHIFPTLEVDRAVELTSGSTGDTSANLIPDMSYHFPLWLPESRLEDLKWLAAITFRVMGCRDVACIDFQLDAKDNDKPYILNINPLPDLNPDISGLCLAAKADNWTYEGLINGILDEAIQRYHLKASSSWPQMITGFEAALPMPAAG